MSELTQRALPFGIPQEPGSPITAQWRGWFSWVTEVGNAFLRGRFYRVAAITQDYTMREVDSAILADASAGNISITLLASADAQGKRLTVKKVDASANTVTVVGTIDGAANLVLSTQYQSRDLVADPDPAASAWWLI